ncbi:MAG: HAD hydrolase family protein [Ignavibacteriales bacterium]|nr:HAD hydrolase family protein [Ignavibacteriales bacterium]
MKSEVLIKIKDIKLFLFDLEGVLLISESNGEQKFLKEISSLCGEFKKRNILFGIITARKKDYLIEELGGCENCLLISSTLAKAEAAEKLLQKLNLGFGNVFYIGDEILDIPLLQKCGLSAAPDNSKREVKRSVDFIVKGNGASETVKEILDIYDKAQLQ